MQALIAAYGVGTNTGTCKHSNVSVEGLAGWPFWFACSCRNWRTHVHVNAAVITIDQAAAVSSTPTNGRLMKSWATKWVSLLRWLYAATVVQFVRCPSNAEKLLTRRGNRNGLRMTSFSKTSWRFSPTLLSCCLRCFFFYLSTFYKHESKRKIAEQERERGSKICIRCSKVKNTSKLSRAGGQLFEGGLQHIFLPFSFTFTGI